MMFRHLLKTEFRNGIALASSAGLAGATALFFGPGVWSAAAALALLVLGLGVAIALMRKTPWCADTAFWRTRPIAPGMLWAARSVALVVLIVVPVGAVTWISLAGLGARTQWLGVGLFGGGALLAAGGLAAILAAGSRSRDWAGASWGIVVVPGILVSGLLARFTNPVLDRERSMLVWLCTLLILTALAWVAWWQVARGFRWRRALWLVGLGSASAPLLAWALNTVLYAAPIRLLHPPPETRQAALEVSDSGRLRLPLRVTGLGESEFVVPTVLHLESDRLRAGWKVYGPGGFFGPVASSALSPHSRNDVFSSHHRGFVGRVKLEALWEHLRERVPQHASWEASDPGRERFSSVFNLPDPERFQDPGLKAVMAGKVYRFRRLRVVTEIAHRRIDGAPGRLRLVSAEVPGPSAIDVRLNWLRPAADPRYHGRFLSSAAPPELWGILFHPASGAAYGAASLRDRRLAEGPASILVHRTGLVLRFDLPALETTLLGLDARQVLAESQLHLFTAEFVCPIMARLQRDQPR